MRCRLLIATGTILFATGAAQASALPSIAIEPIAVPASCRTVVLNGGTTTTEASSYTVSQRTRWRTWLAHDCERRFVTVRNAVAAALAATGRFDVVTLGAANRAAVSISAIDAPATQSDDDGTLYATVSVALKLMDRIGRLRSGDVFAVKESIAGNSDGAAATAIEQHVALAIARRIAFAIEPLHVVAVQAGEIRLDYRSPLVDVGTLVQVLDVSGRPARFIVAHTDMTSATAEPDGDVGAIRPGTPAIVIERDSVTAISHRLRHTTLP